ncbi:procyclic form-specific polypeptide A-beta-like [Seriola lalandi dorsalis]|uniref:procyclic form-specific polypeptide A-beta-like n=1 Tax=Seriola lalandi dorsalis TaxID=1841481 RepID=UPI000C6F7510|nr:procyclic form-specific polypeptide A-beta-like [Seriola lalandi dorsalis]
MSDTEEVYEDEEAQEEVVEVEVAPEAEAQVEAEPEVEPEPEPEPEEVQEVVHEEEGMWHGQFIHPSPAGHSALCSSIVSPVNIHMLQNISSLTSQRFES